MLNLTGFYDLQHLDNAQLHDLYERVLYSSHQIVCESKYTDINKWRGIGSKYSISDYMSMIDVKNHNVFIDRSIQGANIPGTDVGEVGFKLDSKYESEWHQITFMISLPRMKEIADFFNLDMK